ncbi:hypothetical protein [Bdellovibrio sp. BCCA]|uniref:hypothetical protein n=1 Tax=Bdellovibrio sp. BCCA TaxID=3136281 RepID=UPI0030F1F475
MKTEKIFLRSGSTINVPSTAYARQVRKLEREGATTSDAQGMADLHFIKKFMARVKEFSEKNHEELMVLRKAVDSFHKVNAEAAPKVSQSMLEVSQGIGDASSIENVVTAIQLMIKYDIEVVGHTIDELKHCSDKLLALCDLSSK